MQITLTRAQLESTRTILLNQGIDLEGDSGTVSHQHVSLSFSYIEPILMISVISKPFFITEDELEGKIERWFAQN